MKAGSHRPGRCVTDIRKLRSFVHVAWDGSITRAAERLHIAQPALSRQLHKLEEELGVALLVRHGRGVTLTQRGTLLLKRAEALIRQFEEIRHEILTSEGTYTGHVVIGVPPAAGLLIAPAVFKLFRARWPNATLQFREGVSSLLEEWLLDRRLDIAVLHNPPPMAEIDVTPVLHERMVLACLPSAAPRGRSADPLHRYRVRAADPAQLAAQQPSAGRTRGLAARGIAASVAGG